MTGIERPPLERAHATVIRAFAATEALADLDDNILDAAAAVAARALTPVPPLTCPRCGVGQVWGEATGDMHCVDPSPGSGGRVGCGASWDAVGSPS